MYISSSNVGMNSARNYSSFTQMTYQATITQSEVVLGKQKLDERTTADNKGQQSLEEMLSKFRGQPRSVAKPGSTSIRDELEKANRIRQQCMKYVLEVLFRGNKKETGRSSDSNSADEMTDALQQEAQMARVNTFQYKSSYFYSETENVSFSTTGKVVTADGQEIDFNLELELSRSFEEYYETNYSVTSIAFCDPLVINLDCDKADVTDQKILFDLDADGEEDSISMLKPGSGYLALDKNGDGMINNGSELFGAKSGDGFADLAIYDEDGNGWIDENDEIFSKLMIWCKDQEGKDVLYKLADRGVGAICLKNVPTKFALNSEQDNTTNAYIRKTGIFLYENGATGTVQHLDLAR